VKVSWDDFSIPNCFWKVIKHVPNRQPVLFHVVPTVFSLFYLDFLEKKLGNRNCKLRNKFKWEGKECKKKEEKFWRKLETTLKHFEANEK
jgi:hypothetical protein